MTPALATTLPWLHEGIAVLLEVALKAALLWSLAFVATFLLGRRRAFARSAVWQACILSWVLLPCTASFLPRLRLDCLPEGAPAARSLGARARPVPHAPSSAATVERSLLESVALLYEEAVTLPRSPRIPPRPRSATVIESAPACVREASQEHVSAAVPEGFDWRLAIFAVYAAGVVYLTGRLAASLLEVRRLGRSGVVLQGAVWSRSVDEWKQRLGVRRPVRLACTKAIQVPVVLGWLRPKILLPLELVLTSLKKHRGSVLAHELAHVRRADYVWQILTHAVRIAYWPHPLAWAMARSLEKAREEACDDISVFLLQSARRYRAALLRVARLALKRPTLALGLAMARSSELGERVGRIESGCRSARCSAPGPAKWLLASVLVIVASAVGALEFGRRDSRADPASFERTLEVHALDHRTHAPIEGAWVAGFLLAERIQTVCPLTNREGRTRFPIASGAGWDGFTVRVKKTGFVPFSLTWNDRSMGFAPAELALELQPAASIGGSVVDEEGKPIAGATVRLSVHGKPAGERADLLEEPFETGKDGRWRCDFAPSDLGSLQIRVTHPEYIFASFTERPCDRLRERSAVIVLKRGLLVEGRIIDVAGRPVPGATVLEGMILIRLASGQRVGMGNVVRSGADGSFRFGCAVPGELPLTVESPGRTPLLVKAQVTGTQPPLEIRLEPGQAISGRVEDGAGRPLAGARVEACIWHRTSNLDWNATTDADGRFTWNDAPADAFSLSASKRGYVALQNQELARRENELVMVLDPVLRVHGKVVDAATDAPVERFTVARGSSRGDQAQWDEGSFAFKHGNYEIVFPRPKPAQVLRIEAEGYLPAVSRDFGGDEGLQTFNVRLERGAATWGTVTDGAGRPVEAADVVVLSSLKKISLIDGKLDGEAGFDRTRTGADGRFSLNPQEGVNGLLVMHAQGVALIDRVDASHPLAVTLQPWGRVAGELRLGGKGVAVEKIRLSGEPRPGMLHFKSTVTTAEDGRFMLERVLPGRAQITHEVNVAPASRGGHFESTRNQVVTVAPGAVTRVVLGGWGRSVVGRLVKSTASTGDADWSAGYVSLRQKEAEGSFEPACYAAPLRADGSFRLDDVAPGVHYLAIAVFGRHFKETGFFGQELAALRREIEVPSPGDGSAPQELGAVEVTVHRELSAGAPAPPFTVKTVSGETVRLEDFRGKVVLLDFWATWCGPCVALTPDLKALHAAFEKDGGFAIIGLSLDEDPEAPRKYAAKQRLPWAQGLIGEWSESTVRAEYGISSIPRMILIGRDGKIIAKDLLGPNGLKSLVAEALARKEGP